jgi:fatty-acyl-CoA synthase
MMINSKNATHSYHHRGGDTPLLGRTIPQHFAEIVRRFPEQEAVVSLPQQQRLNYQEFAAKADQLACGLLALGYKRGERIGIWSTNNIEWLLLQMATARIGVVLVNINPAYLGRELAYALERSEVQGLFLIPHFRSSDYIALLQELLPTLDRTAPDDLKAEDFPHLRHVVVYDPRSAEQTQRPAKGFTLWQEVLQAGEGVSPSRLEAATAELDFDDPINIQYTSGTTGFPKAVVLSHHNILNNAWFSARAMHFTEQDRLVVIASEHFDAGEVLNAVEAERCTAIHGVPTMFIAELEHPDFAHYDLSTLRTGIMAGAPCPAPLMKQVMEQMHCREILIGYGQTEASPLTHLTSRDDSMARRTETVGVNLPHQEVKVIDTGSGRIVPYGVIGEICFRGHHVMHGYYGQAEKTAETIDKSGWLHSGDLGTMDEAGYVCITGRLKEMIIRGGENIYPAEIEALLFTHPKVVQVAVFGIPDEFYGEEVMAWVQLRAGESVSEEELREFCKKAMAHYKVPKHIRLVEEFPMTVTGKLQKFRMRDITIEKMGLSRN